MLRLFLNMLVLIGATRLVTGCIIEEATLNARERIEETRPFEPDGRFRLENVNGTVTVRTWDEPSVCIEAEKAARSKKALEAIEIDVDGEGDFVEVMTRLPRTFFGGGAKVDYTITLPAQARIQIDTVNGRLDVEGISGEVRATTVNGSVELTDVSGKVETSTVNGSIRAEIREVDPNGYNRFSTTNGSVTLVLPPDAEGEFEARTVNGSISSDFPFDVTGKFGNRRLHGRLGDARGRFDISTVNGSVKIQEG